MLNMAIIKCQECENEISDKAKSVHIVDAPRKIFFKSIVKNSMIMSNLIKLIILHK